MTKNRYPLHQSPIYKILGIGKLEAVLDIKISELDRLRSLENYRTWTNAKGREIQQPIKWLAQVHRRIGRLLARIELPDYVFSQKGRSYIDNAKYHANGTPLGKTDISAFYPSITRQMVWCMFVREFKCAKDVAEILADICCYKQMHLPTGSPLSGSVAFFAAKTAFDAIDAKVTDMGARMSLYVDDLTVSGPKFTKGLLVDICQILRQHGLKTKKAKTKTFAADAPKLVTGVAVIDEDIRLPNARHKRISDLRKFISIAPPSERDALRRSLHGCLQEAKQILKKDKAVGLQE